MGVRGPFGPQPLAACARPLQPVRWRAMCRRGGLIGLIGLAGLVALLGGCASPRSAASSAAVQVYDLGPGQRAPVASNRMALLDPLVLPEVQAPAALDGTAFLYRLLYSDAQQLQPYAHARWSMPPAALVHQQLRAALGVRRAVLDPGDLAPTPPEVRTLQLALEEFSHQFESPQRSVGLVRMRATLTQPGPDGPTLVAQRVVVVHSPAPSNDASGAAQALRAALTDAAAELARWLQDSPPPE